MVQKALATDDITFYLNVEKKHDQTYSDFVFRLAQFEIW